MKFLKWAIFWLAFAALVGFALWRVAINWRPPLSQYPVQGATVSAESGAIHWPSARIDGVDFAYLIATEGDAGRDARFAA
ncbi:MAG: glycosyl hydrolase, partial [Sphingomonadaceae bacterium]|nr:glycosyl hydrolase [Sphingomonadaceae bacterium]